MFISYILLFSATADSILKKTEDKMIGKKAPKDIEAVMIMEIHKGSSVKIRELKAWTKNNLNSDDWKLMKFISPADVKNVGFLTISEDDMFLYLPEFHRIRRIASSSKKDSFMGSDFSYDDLSTTGFSKNYIPEIIKETDTLWILKLSKKKGVKKPYSKIILHISKKTNLPVIMEMFDNSGNLWKKAEEKTKNIGEYDVVSFIKMKNMKKGSWTTLELKDIKLNKGLSKKIFSKRFLKKRVK
jgi:outer membrane lipoprotein-sorting protein